MGAFHTAPSSLKLRCITTNIDHTNVCPGGESNPHPKAQKADLFTIGTYLYLVWMDLVAR